MQQIFGQLRTAQKINPAICYLQHTGACYFNTGGSHAAPCSGGFAATYRRISAAGDSSLFSFVPAGMLKMFVLVFVRVPFLFGRLCLSRAAAYFRSGQVMSGSLCGITISAPQGHQQKECQLFHSVLYSYCIYNIAIGAI